MMFFYDDYENINIGNCVHDFLHKMFHDGLTKKELLEQEESSYEKDSS